MMIKLEILLLNIPNAKEIKGNVQEVTFVF